MLLLAGGLLVGQAAAQSFPRWEAGVGVSVLSMPDYRGSNESRSWIFPIPYLLYRGDVLRIDRQAVRTVFFESQRNEFDLSFAASPPVRSKDNQARRGMPDLDPSFEVGLSWKYALWERDGGNQRLRFVLPVRGVVSTDGRGADWRGWVSAPGLKYDRGLLHSDDWKIGAQLNVQWANERNNEYYYEVTPEYATTVRPAWQARGGYGGTSLVMSATRRIERWWVGGFVRYDALDGAVFGDSPLATARHNWWVGLAVSRVLWQSDEMVERDD